MKKRIPSFFICPACLICAACLVAFSAGTAVAQFGPPAGGAAGAQANQVPLSGRTGQAGSVTASQAPVAGTTNSVNTINPSIQTAGPYTGSTSSISKMPFSGKLSLKEAVARGLEYNLGAVGLSIALQQAQGQARVVRSALMPNINGTLSETVQQTDLKAAGFRFSSPFPGFSIPSIVGPFNYFDLRARLSQTVADLTAWNNYKSAKETLRADTLLAQDSKDLVVLAVGGAYLQVIAAKARVESAKAQLDTANVLYQQTSQQRSVGLLAQIDVNKSQVQMLTQKQRLASLENDFAKQKINLARLTGLPPNDRYDLSDDVPFAEAPVTGEEEAVAQALMQRPDIKAADAQIVAAERVLSAARAERLPSLSLNADYGAIGTNPAESHGTFSVSGTLRLPIWQGGKTEGDIEQANAALAQRRAEREDIRSRVEAEVRNAFLDLQAAASQVEVSRQNLDVTRETLTLTRQRFDAGVTDASDVSQAQSSVASAELDYINSVFAHNVAKLSLARAAGGAADSLARYLKLQ
ncbi:MAG TPA: TolC family protein [Bryobacteraceae bacterium]|jgi:outer membrane protein TolC|nr:TolC family protein [Bryobacteraceae bacterium]